MPKIPELPGNPIPRRSDHEVWLKRCVAGLCQLDHDRFPGSQPVSFGTKDLDKLESQDFWVCEKSDGVRVLLFVQTDIQTKDQSVYIIDRHNSYRQLEGLYFPHHEYPVNPLRNTIVDGELVIDVDPKTQKETTRFLAFDCLIADDVNVMSKPLTSRYGRLQAWFYKPYAKMLQDHPDMAVRQPFEVKVKEVKFSYHVEEVFNIDIPKLQHGNDGLIYTCVNTPYVAGTDPNILKWKPPSENSIDFKLALRFPATPNKPKEPDYFAKPVFELHVWTGDRQGLAQYEFWDVMLVTDDEWEQLKTSGDQLDDRIVEVHWDPQMEGWRMMRFRDDKPNGNHKSVVDNILKSIADGVERDTLLARSGSIRDTWKRRQSQLGTHPPPQQPQQRSGPPPLPAQPQPQAPLVPRPNQQSQPIPENTRPASAGRTNVPEARARYGPLASSPWSKVAGPAMVAGMYR